jgi:hypothetical protein
MRVQDWLAKREWDKTMWGGLAVKKSMRQILCEEDLLQKGSWDKKLCEYDLLQKSSWDKKLCEYDLLQKSSWDKTLWVLTWKTASLAARAMMSAHETMPGQTASTWLLISSTILNPLKVWLGIASLSAVLFGVDLIRTDASQPCTNKSHETVHQFTSRSTSWVSVMIHLALSRLLRNCNSSVGLPPKVYRIREVKIKMVGKRGCCKIRKAHLGSLTLTAQSWKNMRTRGAPAVGSCWILLATTDAVICCKLGHEEW